LGFSRLGQTQIIEPEISGQMGLIVVLEVLMIAGRYPMSG
jgi:hypothetical protein